MINLPAYDFLTNESGFDYEFESTGPKGIIKKVAHFSELSPNIYNFGFGDFDPETKKVSDAVVSNNGDREKIMATVGQIIYNFTEYRPAALIFIKGTVDAKTRLYQMALNKHWENIDPVFEVWGWIKGHWEPFRKNTNYEQFLGRRKASFSL